MNITAYFLSEDSDCTKPADDCSTIPNVLLLQESIVNTFIQSHSFFVRDRRQGRNIHKYLKIKSTFSFWTASSRFYLFFGTVEYYLEKRSIYWQISEVLHSLEENRKKQVIFFFNKREKKLKQIKTSLINKNYSGYLRREPRNHSTGQTKPK